MDVETMRLLASALAMAIGSIAPALGISLLVGRAMEALGRNPEARDSLFIPMVIGIAFTEAIAIYALVVALAIKFVK